jgi:hypothetical protein
MAVKFVLAFRVIYLWTDWYKINQLISQTKKNTFEKHTRYGIEGFKHF